MCQKKRKIIYCHIPKSNLYILCTNLDTMVRRGIVIQQLLQHVGGMCLHQLHNDLLHTPLGSFILQQHPVDVTYLERVCDILDNAVHVDDRQTITCALIIFQVRKVQGIYYLSIRHPIFNVQMLHSYNHGMFLNICSITIAAYFQDEYFQERIRTGNSAYQENQVTF